MRAAVPLLLSLLALACQASPRAVFDSGTEVHVIVRAEPAPKRALRIRPVCTLGAEVVRSPHRTLGPRRPAAEVAILRVPSGRHRLSIFDPRTFVGARGDLEVNREVWVVMEFAPGSRTAKLTAYSRPPDEQVGRWQPLVAVPD